MWRCALFACICLFGCVDKGERAELYFGSESWGRIEKATNLVCARVADEGDRWKRVGPWYDPGEDTLLLYSLLQNPRAYDWDDSVKEPKAEFVLRFQGGDAHVDVLLSLTRAAISVPSRETGARKWASIRPKVQEYRHILAGVFKDPQLSR